LNLTFHVHSVPAEMFKAVNIKLDRLTREVQLCLYVEIALTSGLIFNQPTNLSHEPITNPYTMCERFVGTSQTYALAVGLFEGTLKIL
jgi:hypothetical protein